VRRQDHLAIPSLYGTFQSIDVPKGTQTLGVDNGRNARTSDEPTHEVHHLNVTADSRADHERSKSLNLRDDRLRPKTLERPDHDLRGIVQHSARRRGLSAMKKQVNDPTAQTIRSS
jgi:hypothetical protein